MTNQNQHEWTDNPTVSGISICDTDILNECLMHLKYNNNIKQQSSSPFAVNSGSVDSNGNPNIVWTSQTTYNNIFINSNVATVSGDNSPSISVDGMYLDFNGYTSSGYKTTALTFLSSKPAGNYQFLFQILFLCSKYSVQNFV
jgi:hypothetical protein